MFSSNTSQVVSADFNYIESVFSTYLYTGNGSTQTITNGIDLAGKGGLVWIKDRTTAQSNNLFDTARGPYLYLESNGTNGSLFDPARLSAFTSSGFSVESRGVVNLSGSNFASWTFRKQPKFFDVVTYTGTGSTQNISHDLGSVPGCMIVKSTSNAGQRWNVYHRAASATPQNGRLALNTSDAYAEYPAIASFAGLWNLTQPTGTVFTVGNNADTNTSGATYVAYLFAHDAGGFGLTGTDNVISCGSYVGNGSATGPVVTLGYEPQWVLVKRTTDGIEDWEIYDNMRGIVPAGADQILYPNQSISEQSATRIQISATGFSPDGTAGSVNASGKTYIYIAIRRGPMKTPTLGTSVFAPVLYSGNSGNQSITAGFPVDMEIVGIRNGGGNGWEQGVGDRLRGNGRILSTAFTSAENNWSVEIPTEFQSSTGTNRTTAYMNFASLFFVDWMFRRAPGFFDVVCYTGTGVDRTVAHNLAAVPEMAIIKCRSNLGTTWNVYHSGLGYFANGIDLQLTDPVRGGGPFSAPPTTTLFTPQTGGGSFANANASGNTYVTYLFATCPGVSKVGSYTGTGALQTVACGFTTGARLVLIKRTDSTGDWYVWDSVRGITSGNDPYLLLNSTAAEVTGTNYVDTDTTGFKVTAAAPAGINAVGGTYIFLAIA